MDQERVISIKETSVNNEGNQKPVYATEHAESELVSDPPTPVEETCSDIIFNTAEIADGLSKSVTQALNRTIEHKSSQISTLVRGQEITLESLEHANTKFKDQAELLTTLNTVTDKTRLYKDKIMMIKKKMDNIKTRSQHLKKTAAKLHTQKEKLMVDKEELKRQEIEREQLLTAQELTVSKASPL